MKNLAYKTEKSNNTWRNTSKDYPCPGCHSTNGNARGGGCSYILRDDGTLEVAMCRAEIPRESFDRQLSLSDGLTLSKEKSSGGKLVRIIKPKHVNRITPHNAQLASETIVHRVYEVALDRLELSESDHRLLTDKRGFTVEQIEKHKYRTLEGDLFSDERLRISSAIVDALHAENITDEQILGVPGFLQRDDGRILLAGYQGIVIPVWNIGQKGKRIITALRVRRYDSDIAKEEQKLREIGKNDKVGKYAWISTHRSWSQHTIKPRTIVHIPPWKPPSETVRITEGEFKAHTLNSTEDNILTLSIPGVDFWKKGIETALKLPSSKLHIVVTLDSDVMDKPGPANALMKALTELASKKSSGIIAEYSTETWDSAHGKGIDDVVNAGKYDCIMRLDGNKALEFASKALASATNTSATTKNSATNTIKLVEHAGGSKQHTNAPESTEEPPQIQVSTEQHKTIVSVLDVLAETLLVFQKAGELMQIVNAPIKPSDTHKRDALIIQPISQHRMSEIIASKTTLYEVRKKKEELEKVKVHPPHWLIGGILKRGEWHQIPVIQAVTRVPFLRSNGTVCTKPGYDEHTGMFYNPLKPDQIPVIPENPTLEDAYQAVELLFDLVCDFRFKDENHRAVWLALILSILSLNAFDGPIPFTMIEASIEGEGKTLLASLASIIATGQDIAVQAFSEDDDEMRKVILSLACSGEMLVLFDNIKGYFAGSAIEGAITSRMVSGRVLGKTEITKRRLDTVLVGTSNNCTMSTDNVRRTLLCRLESKVENPSKRDGFKYTDIVSYVKTHKVQLATAALTILRAWFVAGKPQAKLPSFGSFEGWSAVVRNAVYWATGCDPVESKSDLSSTASPDKENLALLASGLEEYLRIERKARVTAGDICRTLARDSTGERFLLLREALEDITERGKVNSRSLGRLLTRNKGKITSGKYITESGKESRNDSIYWTIERVEDQ